MADTPFDSAKPHTLTLKAGTGYDKPWIVLHGTIAELVAETQALTDEAIAAMVSANNRFTAAFAAPNAIGQAAQTFANAGMVDQAQVTSAYAADAASGGPGAFAAPSAPTAPPATAPAAGSVPPPGPAPHCKHFDTHGEMNWRSGISAKTGNPYKMWVCPTPMGHPTQCKPTFLR